MSAHDEDRIEEDRIKDLLRQALPPIETGPAEPSVSLEPSIDLWPAVLRRLNAHPAAHPAAQPCSKWVWFDWALAAGLAVVAVSFPASIPLLLYYL
jgi:hypothetical protein